MHKPDLDDQIDQITEETCPGGLVMVTATHYMAPPDLMIGCFTEPGC